MLNIGFVASMTVSYYYSPVFKWIMLSILLFHLCHYGDFGLIVLIYSVIKNWTYLINW